MAQIFISHSKQDRPIVDYLARVAAGTKVKLIFEELEKMVSGEATAAEIHAHIQQSNAVFVVVTESLTALPHTRDWVLWESGVATNKDIWVLEPLSQLGRVTAITPILKHYVLFEPSDSSFPYFRQIIESYDDSHVLPAVVAGGGLGAGVAKDKGAPIGKGALIGVGLGLLIAALANPRPQGISVSCPECRSLYSIHLLVGQQLFRCPVCNTLLELALPAPVLGILPSTAG